MDIRPPLLLPRCTSTFMEPFLLVGGLEMRSSRSESSTLLRADDGSGAIFAISG